MEQTNAGKMSAKQRSLIALAFLSAGATDVVLGVAIALFGPGFIGGEPLVDKGLVICGIVLALGGVGIIWFGRHRYGASRADQIPSAGLQGQRLAAAGPIVAARLASPPEAKRSPNREYRETGLRRGRNSVELHDFC